MLHVRLLCFLLAALSLTAPAFAAADTVAVLPFFNDAHDSHLDWIGESVAETLRESLAGAGLLALSRGDRVEVYRRLSVRPGVDLTRATVFRIGESMDASSVVYGHFEMSVPPNAQTNSRGQLKLIASILDRKRLRSGPQLSESGPLENLSLMESRLAWQCMRYFQPKSVMSEGDYLKDRPPVRIEAVESYIRGLLSEQPEQQQKLFDQSARIDGRYSEPAFQLGRMAFDKKDYKTAGGWLEKVAPTSSSYHEAQFLLGLCRFYQADYEGAAKQFQQVATDVPLSEVLNDLGAAQSRQNLPQAVENFQKALDGDDADPDYWFNLGFALWKIGRPADAAKNFRAVLERTPSDEQAKLFLARCQRGESPRAGETLNAERLKQTFEETVFLQLQAELKK